MEAAFCELKESPTKSPTLITFDPNKTTIVRSDTSKFGIGAVFEEKQNSSFHPIAYSSRTLNNAEQIYTAHERELLAVVDIFRKWRVYLHGTTFTSHTNYYPQKYLELQKTPSPRRVCWVEKIVAFNFITIVIRRKSNTMADALSKQIHRTDNDSFRNTELVMKAVKKIRGLCH